MLADFGVRGDSGVTVFSPSCLMGNWQEDRTAIEHRLKDYVLKKQTGKLSLTSTAGRLGAQAAPVPLSSAEPAGGPHYGDVLLIRSLCNGGVLALSLAEVPAGLDGDHRKLHCAPIELAGASSRSVFQLLSFEGKMGPVCYDDKVVLVSAGGLFGDAAVGFVHSEAPPMGQQASDQRVSIRVMPAVAAAMPYSAAFRILPAALDARLGSAGRPVGGSDAISFVHAQSGKRLAGLRSPVRTDFGVEFGLTAQTMLANGAVHQLVGERAGRRHLTGYGVKPEYDENSFCFVRAAEPVVAEPAAAPGGDDASEVAASE